MPPYAIYIATIKSGLSGSSGANSVGCGSGPVQPLPAAYSVSSITQIIFPAEAKTVGFSG